MADDKATKDQPEMVGFTPIIPAGGDAQVQTPVAPPASPPPEAPKASLSPADILFELDKRGFVNATEALAYIKRYDDVIAESKLMELKISEREFELKTEEARLEAREEALKAQAMKLLDMKKDNDAQLEQMKERMSILSKLGA